MDSGDRLKQLTELKVEVHENGYYEEWVDERNLNRKSLIATFSDGGKEYAINDPFNRFFNTSRRSVEQKNYHNFMLSLLEKEGINKKTIEKYKKNSFILELHILYTPNNNQYQFVLPSRGFLSEKFST